MEPRIQYTQTEDGVSIAYSVSGAGPTAIVMPQLPWSHLQAERRMTFRSDFIEAIQSKHMLVRYDNRGSGLSTRDVADYSLDAHVRDLEAVAERVESGEFTLLGWTHSVPVAISYAAKHPERVASLILVNGYRKASEHYAQEQPRASVGLIDQDWQLATESIARAALGWEREDLSRQIAVFFRECITQEGAQRAYRAIQQFDASDSLADVQAPTLVVRATYLHSFNAEVTNALAAGIAGASLVVVENEADIPDAIADFTGDSEPAPSLPQQRATATVSGLVTILFTDMESSTALTQSLGDAKAQELVRAHNTIVREALSAHDGTEIKHTGDGIMASFGGASSALGCAVAIQRAVAARAAEQPDIPLGLRVGLNAGEPVVEEQDLFGASVQLARRICDHAEPGQVLASNVVRELAMGKGFLFSDIGEVVPKGFDEAVRLYEVRWRE